MISVSIDPGVRRLGFAVWDGPDLVDCGLGRSDTPGLALEARAEKHLIEIRAHGGTAAARAVVESMEANGSRVPPQDLVDVQTVGCLTAAWLAPSVFLLAPSIWKSAVPKDIHHRRNREVLTPRERLIVDAVRALVPAANEKEVLDAVGIGLYYHRRTQKSGGARI